MPDPAAAKQAEAVATQTEEKGLLDQIVEQGRFGADPVARERGKNLVKEFVAQVLDGSMTVAKDAEMMINARIAQIGKPRPQVQQLLERLNLLGNVGRLKIVELLELEIHF